MEHADFVVLGAGLTGLSFAYHYDPSIPVFEKESSIGGLVRTLDVEGFKFDLAPHLLHLRSDYVKDLVFNQFRPKLAKHIRKARIHYDNRVIPYPFELNLYSLSSKIKQNCLRGLEEVERISRATEDVMKISSYREYAMKAFGRGIAEHYLLPYNRKIWDTDPRQMTCEWMRRLPTAQVEKIRKNAFAPDTDMFGYNVEFFYPENGIKALAEAFGNRLKDIRLNRRVIRIDTSAKQVYFTKGDSIQYGRLVSTLPLRTLVDLIGATDLQKFGQRLVGSTVYCISLVISGTVPEGVHWMYFPEKNFPFYRISFPKNYFPKSTPGDEQILSVEVGSRNMNLDMARLRNQVIETVMGMAIFNIKKLIFTYCTKIPDAYCIYDFERTKTVNSILADLKKMDIESVGRYGRWEYSAMEDAILQGMELAVAYKGAL